MRYLLLASLLVVGCGFKYNVVTPSGEQEAMLLSETERFAGLMGVKVRGEITDKLAANQVPAIGQQPPTAWYSGGVAYYYRPLVKNLSIEPEAGKETCTNVACHEVAHAIERGHDLKHWKLCEGIATPTYPRPDK